MKLSDCSSPYDPEENEPKKFNKTLRKKITDQKQFEFLINRNEEDDGLANFNPIEPSKITKSKEPPKEDFSLYKPNYDLAQNTFVPPPSNYPPPVIHQPYFQPVETPQQDKMNYIIRLLEEQRDQKTDTVTEDLILYGFLGIFIIFVLDSFIKTGKEYTR
jgi:hypothetical protein